MLLIGESAVRQDAGALEHPTSAPITTGPDPAMSQRVVPNRWLLAAAAMLGWLASTHAQDAIEDRPGSGKSRAELTWISADPQPVADHLVTAALLDWNGEVVVGTRECLAGDPSDERVSIVLLAWGSGQVGSRFASGGAGRPDWFGRSLASTDPSLEGPQSIFAGADHAAEQPGELFRLSAVEKVERLMQGTHIGDNLGREVLAVRRDGDQFLLVGAPGAQASHMFPTPVSGAILCLRVATDALEPVARLDGEPLLGHHLEYLPVATPNQQTDLLVTTELVAGTRVESLVFVEWPGLKRVRQASLGEAEAALEYRMFQDLLRCGDVDRDGIDDLLVVLSEKEVGAAVGRSRVILVSAGSGSVVRDWPSADPTVLGFKLGSVIGGKQPAFLRIRSTKSQTSLMPDGTIELCGLDDSTVVTLIEEGPEGMEPVAFVRDGRSQRMRGASRDFGVVFGKTVVESGRRTLLTRVARFAVTP